MSIRVKKRKTGVGYQAVVKAMGRQFSKMCDTPAEARQWINEKRYFRDAKKEFVSVVKIDALFASYIEHCKSKGKALTSIYLAEKRYKKYLFPVFRGLDLVEIPIEQYDNFIRNLPRHFEIKPATINRVRSLMQAMFSVAIKKRHFGGAFKVNPFSFVEKLSENRPEIKYWSRENAEKFLSYTKGSHYYPLWVLMLHTGMRIGECIALDRSQVDTYSDVITVRATWCDVSKSAMSRTKGRRVRRIGIAQIGDVKKTLYPILPESGLVFKNEITGGPVKRDGVSKHIFPRLCKEAGVPNITVHGMRHTFASHYMMNGGNINDLAEILGHSTVQLTRDYYLHFSEDHIQKRGRVVQFGSVGDKVVKINFGNDN